MKPLLLVTFLVAAPQFAKAQDDCGCNASEAAAPDVVETATPASDKVLLRLNLKAGQKFLQQMEMNSRSTTVTKSMRFIITQTMSMTMNNEVLSVSPDGNTEVRSTFGDAKMTMEMVDANGKTLPGAKESQAASDSIFKAIKGKSLTVTFTPRAQIIKTTGAKEFIDAVFRAIPAKDKAERASVEAMSDQILKGMTDNKQGMMKMMAPLPEKPIGVGDSWQEENQNLMLGSEMTTTTNYTVTALANQIAHTEIKTKMSLKNTVAAGKDKPQIAMNGTFSGAIDYDGATGLARSSALKIYSTTRVTMMKNGNPDPALASTSYSNSTMTTSTTSPTS